jgi:hypothetical protein
MKKKINSKNREKPAAYWLFDVKCSEAFASTKHLKVNKKNSVPISQKLTLPLNTKTVSHLNYYLAQSQHL